MAGLSWTVDQVLALAPDASAARAGRELGSARRWLSLGCDSDAAAVWGEIRGSAREPYQVAVDLTGPAFLCSCPSRKVPCKHALGLFLVATNAPGATIAIAGPPEPVAEWLERRRKRATQRASPPGAEGTAGTSAEAAATAEIAPSDGPESSASTGAPRGDGDASGAGATAEQRERALRDQALRIQRRELRIDAGVDDLDRWLQDFARAGLAEMASRPWSTFDQVAARLVDAQAPGLARMVRDIGALSHTQANWPERMLIALGRLTLLLQAWRQRDALDPDLRAEVRGLVGINEARESVLSRPPVHDIWHVAGRRLLEGERMSVQRTWLWGSATRRWALILEFSAGGQPLDRTLLPGMRIEADLCFYPGAVETRALVANTGPRSMTSGAGLPRETVEQLGARYAALLGRNPWLERTPTVLGDVVPMRTNDGAWNLLDAERRCIELSGGDGWQLLAASGGESIDVIGEWDGFRLWPLGVQVAGGVSALREREAVA